MVYAICVQYIQGIQLCSLVKYTTPFVPNRKIANQYLACIQVIINATTASGCYVRDFTNTWVTWVQIIFNHVWTRLVRGWHHYWTKHLTPRDTILGVQLLTDTTVVVFWYYFYPPWLHWWCNFDRVKFMAPTLSHLNPKAIPKYPGKIMFSISAAWYLWNMAMPTRYSDFFILEMNALTLGSK